MRYIVLLLLASMCFYPTRAQDPNDVLKTNITIHLEGATLEDLFQQITKLEKVGIVFSPKHLPEISPKDYHINNQPLYVLLNDVLKDLPLKYSVVEDQVIIKKFKKETPGTGKKEVFTLNGYIKDASNGEILIGATVLAREINKGTITNLFGYYSLSLPEGEYLVSCSYVGYQSQQVKIVLKANRYISFNLPEETTSLKEVVISAAEKENALISNQMSQTNLAPRQVSRMPSLLGEPDVVKSLQVIPGIQLYADGSTSFHVRGGGKDQNLILLDDAPIYNPAHLLGLFSSIIPESVKQIKIYKGDIPVKYGGRLSSLIDIRTREGDMEKYNFEGSIGLLTNKFTINGPIKKNKSSFITTLRRSHIDWILKREYEDSELYFYDWTGKINWKPNYKHRLFLSWYFGEDYFSLNNAGLSWGNNAISSKWNWIPGPKFFMNTTITASLYDYNLITSLEDDIKWNSSINSFNFKMDFTWYPNVKNTMKFGLQQENMDFNPGNIINAEGESPRDLPFVYSGRGRLTSLYLGNEQQINEKISLRYGLRFPTWENFGESVGFSYDDNYQVIDTIYYGKNEVIFSDVVVEPRLSLLYNYNTRNTFKFSYTRASQFIHNISNSISPFMSLEVWMPSGNNIAPQSSVQIAGGYVHAFNKNIELNIEGFYKTLKEQIDYDYHASMILNPLIEGELRFGEGRAYGIETILHKKTGKLNGWIAYTRSRSWRKFEDIYGSEPFPAINDRPNELSIYLNYEITRRWKVSANWNYLSGLAFTTPTGFYTYNNYVVPVYAKKNNDRLPPYHRLDVSTTIRLDKTFENRFEHFLEISILNIYGRKNPIFVYFNKSLDENNNLVIPADMSYRHRYVPSFRYVYWVIPSIRYIFRF